MRHTTKQIEGVAKKLRKLPTVAKKLPAPAKAGHTAEKAVQTVQDELVKLLASGYSVGEVGKVLRSAGIEVSAVTLRGYVRNSIAASKRAAGAGSPNAAPVKKKVATQKSATRSASSTSTAVGNAPVSHKKPATPPPTAKTRTPASKRAPTKSSSGFHDYRNLQLAKSTFVVRPDTPDSDL